MQLSSATCLYKAVRTSVCAAFFAPVLLFALPSHAAGLERFLNTFHECDPIYEGSLFGLFANSLAQRYGNVYSEGPQAAAEDESVEVAIPADLAAHIGPISSRNAGDHTLVSMPLKGELQGLALQKLEMAFANENGIYATVLVFNASSARVQQVFGDLVARGQLKGEAHRANGAGYSATIPRDNPGRILCDWSH